MIFLKVAVLAVISSVAILSVILVFSGDDSDFGAFL